MNLNEFVERAKKSSWHKWILNQILSRMIPFNKPHAFTVEEIRDYYVKVRLPYKRKNLNHIKGIHACALATVSEFATGFLLLASLDATKYRIIMQRLEMAYHYQGKTDAFATFEISPEWIRSQIMEPLKTNNAIIVPCEIKIHDVQGNHLSTGSIFWQIKDWANVKTKK